MALSKKRSSGKKAMKRSSSKKRKSSHVGIKGSKVKRKSTRVKRKTVRRKKRKGSSVKRKSRSRVMKGGNDNTVNIRITLLSDNITILPVTYNDRTVRQGLADILAPRLMSVNTNNVNNVYLTGIIKSNDEYRDTGFTISNVKIENTNVGPNRLFFTFTFDDE